MNFPSLNIYWHKILEYTVLLFLSFKKQLENNLFRPWTPKNVVSFWCYACHSAWYSTTNLNINIWQSCIIKRSAIKFTWCFKEKIKAKMFVSRSKVWKILLYLMESFRTRIFKRHLKNQDFLRHWKIEVGKPPLSQ